MHTDIWDKLLEDFAYYMLLERSLSENTRMAYLADCKRFVEYLHGLPTPLFPDTITVKDLEEFLISLEKTKTTIERKQIKDAESMLLKTTSQIRIIQGIRAFFKFMILKDEIAKNPAELLDLPKQSALLPDILEREEIQNMLKIHENSTILHEVRNRLIINLLYATGLRVSELTNLKLSDINFKEEYLDIIGKGDKERLVPIDPDVLHDLQDYIERYRTTQTISPESSNYVFLSDTRGKKLTRQFIFKMLRETALQAGITKNVHPHILRHSFATELLRAGASLIAVKEILGHVSVATTEIYINLNTQDLKKTLQKCHPLYQNKEIQK